MVDIQKGTRVIGSYYGYYGSIDKQYVIYELVHADLLHTKKQHLAKLESYFNVSNENCNNTDPLSAFEHIFAKIQEVVTGNPSSCVHKEIHDGDLQRIPNTISAIVPIYNRVVSSEILELLLDNLNLVTPFDENQMNEKLDNLVKLAKMRLPDDFVRKLLNLLQSYGIPTYDVEEDSRLIALGEGEASTVIIKNLEGCKFKWLSYPYPSPLDLDELDESTWSIVEIPSDLVKETNLDNFEQRFQEIFPRLDFILKNGVIPKHLVTGTNGKTSVTRMFSHILRQYTKKRIGITSTSGIYIDGLDPLLGDFTGPWSAREALLYPIDLAVFEVARGGLTREGVIFDKVETSIVTNVAADHIGLKGINSVEEMAKLKTLVYQAAEKCIVVNVDNIPAMDAYSHLKATGNLKPNIEIIGISTQENGLSQFDKGVLLIGSEIYVKTSNSEWSTLEKIGSTEEFPFSDHGVISFMNLNAAIAIGAALGNEIPAKEAFQYMISFEGGVKGIPGRGNLFQHADRWFMIDYGHNPHALREIKLTIQRIQEKYGISTTIFLALTAGDRRDKDLRAYGEYLSSFPIDYVIFKDLWVDRRGRDVGEVGRFVSGVMEESGFTGEIIQEPEPVDAVKKALSLSKKNSLVYLCAEKLDIIRDLIFSAEYTD